MFIKSSIGFTNIFLKTTRRCNPINNIRFWLYTYTLLVLQNIKNLLVLCKSSFCLLRSWNAYPKYVHNSIINRLKSKVNRNDSINNSKDDRKVIWINVPYLGKKGEQLTNSPIIKLKRSFKENIKPKTVYKTNELSMFCNPKDSISAEQK